MKKRIIAALFSLVVALSLAVGIQAPASAASASMCAWDGRGWVKSCVQLTWVLDRVTITSVGHSTPNGCGLLENSGGKYAYKAMDTTNGSYYWPTLGCSSNHGVYDYCTNGCTTRVIKVHVYRRLHGATDSGTTFTVTLRNNGTFSWSSDNY